MKTTQLQTLRCLSCGSSLNHIDGAEEYVCKKCGEIFDLRGFSSMDLDLEEFDRLLLYTLKKKRTERKHSHQHQVASQV
jgi:predicted RNA-binding Zn-ribbon protein involved in translation (DUF1610 family)